MMIFGLLALLGSPNVDMVLKLKAGDRWTAELVCQYKSEDGDIIEVDTIQYEVTKGAKGLVFKAQFKLKETRTPEGDVVPAPAKIEPIVSIVSDVEREAVFPINDDVVRYRIERFLMPPRQGQMSEPLFFPPPQTARVAGFNRIDRPADRTGNVMTSTLEESIRDRPMQGNARFTFDPITRILMKGSYSFDNVPIPGGSSLAHLNATFLVKSISLKPR